MQASYMKWSINMIQDQHALLYKGIPGFLAANLNLSGHNLFFFQRMRDYLK